MHVMGKAYEVPADLTIMKAMEYVGYKFIRGAGCRAGFCGACATLFRKKGNHELHAALACQKLVEDGMYVATIPFAPSEGKAYDIDRLIPYPDILLEYYPEIGTCLSCKVCSKTCPQGLRVMDYVHAAAKGDLGLVTNLSFDCIACGLCALRCPAEIAPYNVAQLARRLYAKRLAKTSEHLTVRLKEIHGRRFDEELKRLKRLDREELKRLYTKREIRA